MDFGAQLLEPLLVRDAEMLLLVDDDEAEVLELDGLAEERMGADDNVDAALGDALLHPRQFLRRNQTRGLRDVDRVALQALGEGLGVLAGEQRGRHHDGDLFAVHGGDEGGAQRHLGLAEADVAADQPVHRPAGAEIVEHGGDGGLLVVGLLVGKAGAELVVQAGGDGEQRRFAQLPLGRDLDQFAGDLADAVLHPRLARLPGAAAEPVELDAGAFRAVAREQLDVLDRQEQLVAAGVVDFQAVVRRAGGLDGAQAAEAADAVIDVDHEIAGGEARHLGDEILRALGLAAAAHQPLAQNVFFGDQRDVGGLEAGFEAEHGERHLVARPRQRLRPGRHRLEIDQPVLGQHMRHALARAFAPQRDQGALAGGLQRVDVFGHGLEHIGVRHRALGDEIAAGMGADVEGIPSQPSPACEEGLAGAAPRTG